MLESIKYWEKFKTDKVVYSRWETASSNRQAFIDEYLKMEGAGYGKSGIKTYNRIWSPGRNYYYEDLFRHIVP